MPAVSRHNEVFEDEAPDQEAMAAPTAHVPPYLQRKGFVPRTLAGEHKASLRSGSNVSGSNAAAAVTNTTTNTTTLTTTITTNHRNHERRYP